MSRGYVQRLVARHAEPLALRPRTTPKFGPSPRAEGDVARRSVPSGDGRLPRDPLDGSSITTARASSGRLAESDKARRNTWSRSEPRLRSDEHRGHEPGVAADAAARPNDDDRLESGADNATDLESSRVRVDDDGASDDIVADDMTPRPADREGLRHPDLSEIDVRTAPSISTRQRSRELSRGPRRVEAPDTVHVHIGRIEVRAVVSPSDRPSGPPRAAGPAPLSLDSYLRRTRQ